MKRLEIQTEYARIGIKTQMAKMTINNNYRRPRVDFKPAERAEPQVGARVAQQAEIAQQGKTTFRVNWQTAKDSAGVAGVVELSKHFVSGAAPAGELESGTAADQASNVVKYVPPEPTQTEVALDAAAQREQVQPSIQWDANAAKINWAPYELEIEWDDDYMPDFSVEPHSVEIFMENQPSITISVVDDGLMIQHGRNVDRKV